MIQDVIYQINTTGYSNQHVYSVTANLMTEKPLTADKRRCYRSGVGQEINKTSTPVRISYLNKDVYKNIV